jgi:hypothetical protein
MKTLEKICKGKTMYGLNAVVEYLHDVTRAHKTMLFSIDYEKTIAIRVAPDYLMENAASVLDAANKVDLDEDLEWFRSVVHERGESFFGDRPPARIYKLLKSIIPPRNKKSEKPIMGESQDKYCRGCILVPGCNVILKDGESCGDRAEGLPALSYDEWEAMGDNVPGKA